MCFFLGQKEDGFVLSVRSSATPLRHGIALSPNDLATKKVSALAQTDHQAVWERQKISVFQPTGFLVNECLTLRAWLRVGRIVTSQAILVRPKRAVLTILESPIYWCVESIPQVDPYNAVRL